MTVVVGIAVEPAVVDNLEGLVVDSPVEGDTVGEVEEDMTDIASVQHMRPHQQHLLQPPQHLYRARQTQDLSRSILRDLDRDLTANCP